MFFNLQLYFKRWVNKILQISQVLKTFYFKKHKQKFECDLFKYAKENVIDKMTLSEILCVIRIINFYILS